MLGLLRRGLTMLEQRLEPALEEPATAARPQVTGDPVTRAIDIIQHHVDREARNRRLDTLPVRDLCPLQKAELVHDLARILR